MVARRLGIFFFVAAAIVILAMVASSPEWTCREDGGDWQCVGANCNVEANARFDQRRKSLQCERTDWVGAMMGKLANGVMPRPHGNATKPGA
jgi:hypothetical protein